MEIHERKKAPTEKKSVEKTYVRLPKMEITKFGGNYTKWQTFYDSFEAAVNSSKQLTDVEKFTYLRCYLEGDALQCIAGFSLSNENYEKAFELLKERYGNKQMIISAHMNELLKIRKITSDKDLAGLRRIHDEIESHVRSLASLDIEGDNYGTLLVPIREIHGKEDYRTSLSLIVSRNLKL